jgi:hypothetical protein
MGASMVCDDAGAAARASRTGTIRLDIRISFSRVRLPA